MDSTFAMQTKVKQEEQKQEHQEVKRLNARFVLQYEQHEEEVYEDDFPGTTVFAFGTTRSLILL